MARRPSGLNKANRAQAQMEMLLLLGHRANPKSGQPGQITQRELTKLVPALQSDAEGEPFKEVQRCVKELSKCGFSIETNTEKEAEPWVRLTSGPFLPISISGEELELILPLIAAHSAAAADGTGVPPEVRLCRDARDSRRAVTVDGGDGVFSLLPAAEVRRGDRWYVVGARVSDGASRVIRIDGRWSIELGPLVTSAWPSPPPDIDRVLSPLTWRPGSEFEALVDVTEGALPVARRTLGPAMTAPPEQLKNGWYRLRLTPTGHRELHARVAKLGDEAKLAGPPGVQQRFVSDLEAIARLQPVEDGYEDSNAANLEPGVEQLPGPGSGPGAGGFLSDLGPAERILGSAPASVLVGRILLVLQTLDRCGTATVEELAQITGLSDLQTEVLLTCYLDAEADTARRTEGSTSMTGKYEGERLVGVSGRAGLHKVGRYEVTPAQMVAAASAAITELAQPEVEPARAEALRLLIDRATHALGVSFGADPYSSAAVSAVRSELAKRVDQEVDVTYTNPFRPDTRNRTIVPLAKPRQQNGRWVVLACDPDDLEHPKTFYLDYLKIRQHPGKDAPRVHSADRIAHPHSDEDIEWWVRSKGYENVRLRVRYGWAVGHLLAYWGGREVARHQSCPDDETIVALKIYEPVEERLTDLLFHLGTDARVEAPVSWRDLAQREATRLLRHYR